MNQCYGCIYRRDIPGDAHSQCAHPEALGSSGFRAVRDLIVSGHTDVMNIRANQHGVKMGWFAWPFNFDPVWLENCDGYTPSAAENSEEKRETTGGATNPMHDPAGWRSK